MKAFQTARGLLGGCGQESPSLRMTQSRQTFAQEIPCPPLQPCCCPKIEESWAPERFHANSLSNGEPRLWRGLMLEREFVLSA